LQEEICCLARFLLANPEISSLTTKAFLQILTSFCFARNRIAGTHRYCAAAVTAASNLAAAPQPSLPQAITHRRRAAAV